MTLVDNRGLSPIHVQPTQIKLRDYQHSGVAASLSNTLPHLGWWPRGVIKVATGGGKTEMAVAMYEMNPVPTMFLVHRKDLLVQAAERFAKYGHSVGKIGDSKFDPNSDVTIATMQTLHKIIGDPNNARHEETMKLIKNTKQLFFDECHLMASTLEKGNLFVDIASHFENAACRWGLTATPFMRGSFDNLLLESVTGEILYEISNDQLIQMGYLTPPKIRVIDVPGKTVVKRPKNRGGAGDYWRLVSGACIVDHVKRNELIAKEILKGKGPMLCLVSTITQAENIQAAIKKLGGAVPMLLSGKDKTATRRQAVKDLQSGKVRAILCTTIFDEGVDIPELRKVILASGGKSQVKLLQRIGRGLRLAKGKKSVEIVDFADKHHDMVRKHALERMKRFKEEGFEVTK
jgi:superfamily II DNA or RNA helicase